MTKEIASLRSQRRGFVFVMTGVNQSLPTLFSTRSLTDIQTDRFVTAFLATTWLCLRNDRCKSESADLV
ncbi:MAG: hypothetical protein P9X24_18975 [Candidatus Hatepunaea meridiana]|nr:hypothetical protein [Candidatus Hatepunaea meridiana]